LPGNFSGQHPAEGNAANNVIRLNKETLCNSRGVLREGFSRF
jgi:hypothetical protein